MPAFQPPAKILNLVLDAGPIISGTLPPSISDATTTYTTPSVLSELRDETARQRAHLLLPSLVTRVPRPASMQFVRDFARKTGDLAVLSRTDLELIALTYELECEVNGGDWRLRNEPGQKSINGRPPVPQPKPDIQSDKHDAETGADAESSHADGPQDHQPDEQGEEVESWASRLKKLSLAEKASTPAPTPVTATTQTEAPVSSADEPSTTDGPSTTDEPTTTQEDEAPAEEAEADEEDDDDDEGWITPSNIGKHKVADDDNTTASAGEEKVMKVACASADYAMQNVLLQIGLNLISSEGKRITSVRTWVLRCYACFKTTRHMDKKFCPSCGGATLLRTATSTDSRGQQRVHLKRNFQYNTRGTVYAIPSTKAGTANMKGRDNLVLRADQRELQKQEKRDKYKKEVDLLDQDSLPSILTGHRKGHTQDLTVGYGKRNPNAVGRRRK
ncbi:20S-pre-rRNA D-site endonuclease nob1 [Savitreella phatthalungensis]